MRDSEPPPGPGVYAPPIGRDRPHEGGGRASLIFGLIVLVLAAGAGFLFMMLAPGDAPRLIQAEGPYKARPAAVEAAPAPPDRAVYDLMEGQPPQADAPPPAAAEAAPPPPRPAPAGPPAFAADGAWVVQVAALRSEAAAREAWARLEASYAALMTGAAMDVQRADLGPQGIYFRLRVGYFASRADASAFCDRLREAGRDCLVAAREPR